VPEERLKRHPGGENKIYLLPKRPKL